jgi:hypothetical protein
MEVDPVLDGIEILVRGRAGPDEARDLISLLEQ